MKFPFKSIQPLISELQGTFRKSTSKNQFETSDCYGHMVSALRLLGSNVYYDKTEFIDITRYTGKIAQDYYMTKQIWLCTSVEMVYSISPVTKENRLAWRRGSLMRPGDSATMSLCKDYISPGVSPVDQSYRIIVPPGIIRTSKPTCRLEHAYYALPTDEEGIILYPDSENVASALKAYTIMQEFMESFYLGEVNATIWGDIIRRWDETKDAARGDLKAIDPSEVAFMIKQMQHRHNRFKFNK